MNIIELARWPKDQVLPILRWPKTSLVDILLILRWNKKLQRTLHLGSWKTNFKQPRELTWMSDMLGSVTFLVTRSMNRLGDSNHPYQESQTKSKKMLFCIFIDVSFRACTLIVSLRSNGDQITKENYVLFPKDRTKYHDNIWGIDHRVHLQKKNTTTTVKIMPAYLIHWSPRCRLSISFSTELDRPTVFRTSSAFRWALWK